MWCWCHAQLIRDVIVRALQSAGIELHFPTEPIGNIPQVAKRAGDVARVKIRRRRLAGFDAVDEVSQMSRLQVRCISGDIFGVIVDLPSASVDDQCSPLTMKRHA